MDSDNFFRLYNKIPAAERKLTIVVIDGKQITWEMAYNEIKNKTKLGGKISEKLNKLGFV